MADEEVTRMLSLDSEENKAAFIRLIQTYPNSDVVIDYDPTLYPNIQGVVFTLTQFDAGRWHIGGSQAEIPGAHAFLPTPDIEHGDYFTQTIIIGDGMFERVNAFALFAECLRKFRALYLDSLYTP